MQAGDVFYAYHDVSEVVANLKRMRSTSERDFSRIFTEATNLERNFMGKNSNSTCRELIGDNPGHIVGLLHLLPSECCGTSINPNADIPEKLESAVEFYTNDLPHSVLFPTEYRMWVNKWKQHGPGPKKLVDVLCACDSTSFPNIHVLLQLALTLPITSCESERSFSQLKLIKTPHRVSMTSRRLSGLALMKINRYICEKLQSQSRIKELVQLFKELHPRRTHLLYVVSD